jgi:hypothetical protein
MRASEHTRGAHARTMRAMDLRRSVPIFLVAALLPCAALAQAPRAGAPSLAQAERNSVELRQGMSAEDVLKLLGKPRRTALRAAAQGQGSLQWSYFWGGTAASSSSERSLQIEFASKGPDQWIVNSWGWASY